MNRLCTQVADQYGWGFANINLRAYYAEGAKTVRLRDRRAARLALPAARRLAGRRRHAAAAHPQGLRRAPARSAWSTASCRAIHAAQAAGCAPVVTRARGGPRVPRAGQAEHDRQVDRHRQPGRRLPGAAARCAPRAARARWSTDDEIVAGHSAAGRDRRHLHRAGRRRDRRRHAAAHRARRHSARRVDRHLHHRQRLQDDRSARPARASKPIRIGRIARRLRGGRSCRHSPRDADDRHEHPEHYRAVFRCIAGCPGEHSIWQPIYHCPTCGDLLQVAHDVDALRRPQPGRVDAPLRRALQAHRVAVRLGRLGQEGVGLPRAARREHRLDGRGRHQPVLGRALRHGRSASTTSG